MDRSAARAVTAPTLRAVAVERAECATAVSSPAESRRAKGLSAPRASPSMSRRGLSVYAAPFVPPSGAAAPAESPPPPPPPEFPRTPLSATEARRPPQRRTPRLSGARLTPPAAAAAGGAGGSAGARGAGAGAGGSGGTGAALGSAGGSAGRARAAGSASCNSSLQCVAEMTDGADNVRHRRVPFTDAEALDVDTMLDLLRASSSEREDDEEEEEEGAIFMMQQQHLLSVTDSAAGSLPNCDLYECGGGYWDLEGPCASTRRYTRRVNSMVLTSPTVGALQGLENSHNTSYALLISDEGIDDDDELWEMNSSAYADSLDEAQSEWIEEQLRAKENPEGFFF